VRIEIRRNGEAVIVTFDTQAEKFTSNSERNRFFHELHGWKQTVPSGGKRYVYRRSGLLDEIPHIKVADSAFIVAMEHFDRVEKFFDGWADKVECDMMRIMMQDTERLRRLAGQE